MKNYDIINISNAYQNTDGKLKLPVSVAWKRRLNFKKIMEARRVIDETIREIGQEFLDDEHSFPAEGDRREIKPEYRDEYVKRVREIEEQDTPIDILKIDSIDELGDIDISDVELDTIVFMVNIEQEESDA